MSSATLERARPAFAPARTLLHGVAMKPHSDEDRVLVRVDLGLFGVFDGVGGHRHGARAAEVAAAAVASVVETALPACRTRAAAQLVLASAMSAADEAVAELGRASGACESAPPATTATVLLLWPHAGPPASGHPVEALVASLGDSRLHLLRDQRLETVTLDHGALGVDDTYEARARQRRLEDVLDPAQLRDPVDRMAFLRRNLLSAALCGSGISALREYAIELAPGDRLMLDTDGVHDNLTRRELTGLLADPGSASQLAASVVATARKRAFGAVALLPRAKKDDMTAIVLVV